MSTKRESGEGPVDVMIQHYPSPSLDTPDSLYYGNHQHSHQLGRKSDMSEQDGEDQMATSPQQPHARPSVSAEELQLAAQLTQGLAAQGLGPIMAAAEEARRLEGASQQNLDDNPVGHVSEQELEEQQLQEADLQDQHLQTQLQEHLQNQALQHQAQHNQALQNVAQHPGQPHHQYGAMPHQQQLHLQAHVPLDHMGQPQYGMSDNIPPRKRSKVSRACDECRRKKIKCDAMSEGGEDSCSNCKRSNVRCLFSRVPQKRGPSKGYIKELADRIHSIEGKLGGQAIDSLDLSNVSRRQSADTYSPSLQVDDKNRKRPFSGISSEALSTPGSARHSAWAAEHRPIQPYQTPTPARPYSANELAPRPLGLGDEGAVFTSAPTTDGVPAAGEHVRDIHEDIFQGYLAVIHPTFPVLAATKAKTRFALAQCPLALREAFIEALNATVGAFQEVPPGQTGDTRTANRWLAEWESEGDASSAVTNLIHLQTLILMSIETDGHGPASLKGQHGGPSKSSILGRAVGQAYSMGLHAVQAGSDSELDSDPESDEAVARRSWWILVMMDRWSAIGTSTPLMIPNDSVVILPGLKVALGEGVYYLLQLSAILGHFVPLALAPPKELGSGSGPVVSSWINLTVEGFRVNFPKSITPSTHPALHLAYWHCRLLAYLFAPSSLSTDVLWACKESVNLLAGNPHLFSPLTHHFTCLTGLSLAALSKVDKTREEATKLAKDVLGSSIAPSAWDAAIRDTVDEKIRPSTSSGIEATASQSLQHLADLAAATTLATAADQGDDTAVVFRKADNYEDTGFDPRPMLRGGYLNAIKTVDATQAL